MKTLSLFVLAVSLVASPACKKKEDTPKGPPAPAGSATPAPVVAPSGSAEAAPGSGAAAPAEAAAGDWIKVYASHAPAKPKDPVELTFTTWRVVKADFDPKKIEGGKATIELDVTSLKSDSAKRDQDIADPSFLDSAKFTTATVEIDHVKAKADKQYTADAKVKFHGAEKTYPVTFEVLEAKADAIRIKAEHTFSRLDFQVGTEGGIANDVRIQMQVTLKKT